MCTEYGDSKCTYGTGCFMLMNTGSRNIVSKRGLVTTLAASFDISPDYALEGSMFSAGAVHDWLKEGMGLIENESDCADIARKVKNTGGVYLVPAFVGLGAPHWNSRARGTITGKRAPPRANTLSAPRKSASHTRCSTCSAPYRRIRE